MYKDQIWTDGRTLRSQGFKVDEVERYHMRKEWAMLHLSGGDTPACRMCGTTDNLQFDHIDPKQKTDNVTKLLRSSTKEKVLAELDKCQLLCPGCNARKRSADMRFGDVAPKATPQYLQRQY